MEAQRKVPRKNLEKTIGVLVQGHYHRLRMVQIGEGGLLLAGEDLALGVGDRLLVTFSIDGQSFILVRGLVRYRLEKDNQYGIEFEDLKFQNKREIRSFVASHQKARPHLYLVK